MLLKSLKLKDFRQFRGEQEISFSTDPVRNVTVIMGENGSGKAIKLETKEDAQNAPTPITTYAMFVDGDYLTNEQMNDKRFIKLLEK